MHATAVWQGGYATRLDDGRGHAIVVDLPEDEDGRDTGTSSLELAVLSLAGCISTIFALVARKRRLPCEGLRVTLDAERPEGSPTISVVSGVAEVTTSAPVVDVETVLRLTLRTCPVGVLLERAQIPVHVTLKAVSPSTLPRTPA